MNRRAVINALLLSANAALGCWIVWSLYSGQLERQTELEAVRAAAEADRLATLELERQVSIQEATLNALREDDPYVIELMIRDKLGWRGLAEIPPPPLPER